MKKLIGVLSYLSILFGLLALTQFPGWVRDGYLSDEYIPGVPVWVPVSIALFGFLIAVIWLKISDYKNTGKWL